MDLVVSKLDLIAGKLQDVRDGQRSSFWGMAGLLAGFAALILASLAFGSQWFGLGLDTTATMEQVATRAAREAVAERDRTEASPPAPPKVTAAPKKG